MVDEGSLPSVTSRKEEGKAEEAVIIGREPWNAFEHDRQQGNGTEGMKLGCRHNTEDMSNRAASEEEQCPFKKKWAKMGGRH